MNPEEIENPYSDYADFTQYTRMKILVVDDHEMNLELLRGLLESAGFKSVKCLNDSRIVLETCAAFEPDIILLDLMMPYVNGIEVLQWLRTSAAQVFLPIIVLTADVNENSRRKALRAGATDFLLKPFDEIEVLLRIANLLEVRRLHKQLDIQRAAFEERLRERSLELREADVRQ